MRQLYVRVPSLRSLNMKTRDGFSDDSEDKVIIFVRVTKGRKVLSNSLSHTVSKYCRITGGAASAGQHPLVKQKHLINHRQRSVNTVVKWRKTFSGLLETLERLQTEHEHTLFQPVNETVFEDLEHKCVFTLLPLQVSG